MSCTRKGRQVVSWSKSPDERAADKTWQSFPAMSCTKQKALLCKFELLSQLYELLRRICVFILLSKSRNSAKFDHMTHSRMSSTSYVSQGGRVAAVTAFAQAPSSVVSRGRRCRTYQVEKSGCETRRDSGGTSSQDSGCTKVLQANDVSWFNERQGRNRFAVTQ